MNEIKTTKRTYLPLNEGEKFTEEDAKILLDAHHYWPQKVSIDYRYFFRGNPYKKGCDAIVYSDPEKEDQINW